MDYMELLQVVLMGVCTVFTCLVCIIIICKIMSGIVLAAKGSAKPAVVAAPAPKAPQATASSVANKNEFIAAVGSAIAEDMGIDISHIRIHSIKKI